LSDIRKVPDLEERVLAAVRRRTPQAENLRIVSVQQKFIDGILFTVAFDGLTDANGVRPSFTNRVYVTKDGIEAYGYDEFLIQVVGARHARSFYDIFANSDVVSGIIALVVTILIVPTFFISYFTEVTIAVPDWITSGWLLILGFYFGKATGARD
jgi:hypothetical protein